VRQNGRFGGSGTPSFNVHNPQVFKPFRQLFTYVRALNNFFLSLN